jgi:2-oxoglutarate dehydrogenase E2 component (dihydrolipoamide succinyltransferase)
MEIKITVPELGESIVEATVSRWLKKVGEPVAAGEVLVELETDKVNLEVTSEKAGLLANIERQAGEDVQIGDVLGLISDEDQAGSAPEADKNTDEPAKDSPKSATADESPKPAERATPVAKRVAEAHGVDLGQVSKAEGETRLTKQDVESFLNQQEAKPAPQKPAATEPSQRSGQADREERLRMSRRRQTIARRLVEAQQTAAMLTTFNEVDMSAVMTLRQRRQEAFQKRHAIKLGFMSFFVKAAIGALKQFPQVNAEIEGDEIVLKHYYDIGMAIGAAEGLVVPVLREADRMSFAEIEQAIASYVEKAQNGSLSLDDLRGGTFTITNGGVFGSLLSTPILNPPQVGILGLHKIEKRPVVVGDEIAIRPMMYLALSYDHRLVDGREAVQFLVRLKELIEDPETLLLEG